MVNGGGGKGGGMCVLMVSHGSMRPGADGSDVRLLEPRVPRSITIPHSSLLCISVVRLLAGGGQRRGGPLWLMRRPWDARGQKQEEQHRRQQQHQLEEEERQQQQKEKGEEEEEEEEEEKEQQQQQQQQEGEGGGEGALAQGLLVEDRGWGRAKG